MRRVLKVMGLSALAAALKVVSNLLPDLLPAAIGDPLAVAVAAAIAYLLPPPRK